MTYGEYRGSIYIADSVTIYWLNVNVTLKTGNLGNLTTIH